MRAFAEARPTGASQDGAAPGDGEGGEQGGSPAPALQLFTRLTPAAIEALRYRGEDIARSLTKTVIREVHLAPHQRCKHRPFPTGELENVPQLDPSCCTPA